MSDNTIEKSFCTTREAAALLGVSVGTVQLWVESGLLQAWKTSGGHRRVMRDSIDGLLRKSPSDARPPSATAPTEAPRRRLTVMVVEDDVALLRLYQIHVSRWPMAPEVICFDSAVMALLSIGNRCPDLLITDLHMAGMDGFHMVRELRKSTEASKTTIVAVTGLDPHDAAKRGLPPDIEILPKPVQFDRLLEIATDIVRQGQLHKPPGSMNVGT
ncbi:MAG: response regulator [Rhodoferax sp.]